MHLATPNEVRSEDLLKVRTLQEGDSIELHAAGEIDISTIALLEEQWITALARRVKYLTLDLADVTFIDSTGLQFLLRAAAMGGDGTRVQFRSCSEAVRRAIEICGIERHLPLTD